MRGFGGGHKDNRIKKREIEGATYSFALNYSRRLKFSRLIWLYFGLSGPFSPSFLPSLLAVMSACVLCLPQPVFPVPLFLSPPPLFKGSDKEKIGVRCGA